VSPLATTNHGTVPASLPANLFLPDTLTPLTQAQPDTSIPRAVGAARFVWLGGDPAIDYPLVIVERETSPGTFVPRVGQKQEPSSSENGTVVVTYTPDPIDAAAPSAHYYVATWQPVPPDPFVLDDPTRPFALEAGTYRILASGRAHTASGEVTYSIASNSFQIVPAPLAEASAQASGSELTIQASLGGAPGLRALVTGPSDTNLALVGPWTALVTFDDATTKAGTVTPQAGTGVVPLTSAELSKLVSVEVRDPEGNGGVIPID
jgi:hypothetical protein